MQRTACVALIAWLLMTIATSIRAQSADGGSRNPSGAWTLNPWLTEDAPDGTSDAFPEAPEQLIIRMTHETVTFYQTDGSRRVYRLSGHRERGDWQGRDATIRARWDGATLSIEIRFDGGGRMMQMVSFDPESGRLTVTVVPGGRSQSTAGRIRRVYDSVLTR
jgi:hypothetical protein